MLLEHKVHKVLGARQGAEARPAPHMVQQGSQHRASSSGSPCPRCLLQQLRQVHTGLGEELGLSLTCNVAFLPSITAIALSAP